MRGSRASRSGAGGAELRRLRQAAGLRLVDVAAAVGWHKATLSRLETGQATLEPAHVAALVGPLKLTPVARMRLDRLVGSERMPDEWWARYHDVLSAQYEELIYLESQAVAIEATSTLVPGLLQAEGYAEATIARSAFVPDPDDGEALLHVRLQRQRIVTEGQVSLSVTLSELALRQNFCGRVALQQQLRHLLELSELDNVSLCIVSAQAETVPFLGALSVMDFAPTGNSPIALVEYQSGSQLLKEERTVKRYRRELRHWRSAAGSEQESRRMIMDRMGEL